MSKLFLVFLSFLLGALIFTAQTLPTHANPGYEDLTGFTKGGAEAAQLATTATRVTYTDMEYQNEAYCYRDYGVAYFTYSDSNCHYFDFRITARDFQSAGSGDLTIHFPWILANAIGDVAVLNSGTFLAVHHYNNKDQSNYKIAIRERHNSVTYTDVSASYNFIVGNTYYSNVSWSGTSLKFNVYSTIGLRDAGAAGDMASLSLALHANHEFRYLYCFASYDLPYDPLISGYNENYDLFPPDPTFPTHSLMGLNSTLNASGIQFTINLSDNIELDTCLLEWNNTGTLANISYSLSGTNYLLLANQTLHATEAVRIYYRFFFNDSSGNMNVTVQHFLITNTEPLVGPPPPGLSSAQMFVGLMVIVGSIVFVGYLASKK